jgi:hypothetical protein
MLRCLYVAQAVIKFRITLLNMSIPFSDTSVESAMPLVLCVCISLLSTCSSIDMPQPPNDDLYILPDEYKPSSRHKRSLLKSHRNEELNVETLVVVDRKMMQSHGHENITTYVLTILNMVGLMFVCVCVCVCAPECVCVCVCV